MHQQIALLFAQVILLLFGTPISRGFSIDQDKTNKTDLTTTCIFNDGQENVTRNIGSVWIDSNDPCLIQSCTLNQFKNGTQIISEKKDCSTITCDMGMELKPEEGTCCGSCVKTKCSFNNSFYEIGQTWHNNNDCTFLECSELPNGYPTINTYKKTCPPLPVDCPKKFIYIQDCCEYCSSVRSLPDNDDIKDVWTEEFYRKHACARDCQVNEPAMTCHYKFVVEWYQTLSKACFDCPRNVTDCERPHCIIGDGLTRSVMVVNRMMPGPSIEVCLNDIIVVDVKNDLLGESTTIHWHGLHQKETPYMDGVPHITQCPIAPHTTFRYKFKADNPGTHFWHSHTGMQRGDGVFGALIIRKPRSQDPHSSLYDFDLSEHKMILQDWVHMPGISMFADHHHSRGDNKPTNLLINGRGRFYYGIWEQIKAHARSTILNQTVNHSEIFKPSDENSRTTTSELSFASNNETEKSPSDIDFYHPLNSIGRVQFQKNVELPRLARLVNESQQYHQVSEDRNKSNYSLDEENIRSNDSIGNSETMILSKRSKRAVEGDDLPLENIPHQVYNVKRGFRYRFRIINAEFLNCPIEVSIDSHNLTAINSDGYDFEQVNVGSIVTYAGERFDFVVHANQEVANYWIRLKGLMDCSEKFTSAFQVAVFHYEGAANEEPSGTPGYNHSAGGIQLNVMNRGPGYSDSLTIAELRALPFYNSVSGVDTDALVEEADYKFFVYYDFYAKDNPSFHPIEYYGFYNTPEKVNRLFTPQLNHISLKFPDVALLPSRNNIDDSLFCNETSLEAKGIDCKKEFCQCHHVLQVPLGAIVEIIIVDEGFTFDANHPFHLHGNAFRVVGLERLGENVTIDMVKQLDRFKLLKRNLRNPPVKDTVTIPDGGYTIIRLEASNPGFWLFHCHIEFHAEIGMALILKVGNNDQMLPVPKNFPTCHNYVPDDKNSDDNDTEESIELPTTTEKPKGNGSQTIKICFKDFIMINLLIWVHLIITTKSQL